MANINEKSKLELELFSLYELYNNRLLSTNINDREKPTLLSIANAYCCMLYTLSEIYTEKISKCLDESVHSHFDYIYGNKEERTREEIKKLKPKIKEKLIDSFRTNPSYHLNYIHSRLKTKNIWNFPIEIIIKDDSIIERIVELCSNYIRSYTIKERKHFSKICKGLLGTEFFSVYAGTDNDYSTAWLIKHFPKELLNAYLESKNLDYSKINEISPVNEKFEMDFYPILTDISCLFSRDKVDIIFENTIDDYIKNFYGNKWRPSNPKSAQILVNILSKKGNDMNIKSLVIANELPVLFAKKCEVIPSFYTSNEDAIKKMCFLYINKRADNIKDLINLYETEKWREKVLDKLDIQNNLFNEVGKALVISLNNLQKHASTVEKHLVDISKQISDLDSTVRAYSSSSSSSDGAVVAKLEAIRMSLL